MPEDSQVPLGVWTTATSEDQRIYQCHPYAARPRCLLHIANIISGRCYVANSLGFETPPSKERMIYQKPFDGLKAATMAKIWFGRQETQSDQSDLKGEKDVSWCENNLGLFHISSGPDAKDTSRRIPNSSLDAELLPWPEFK